MIRQSVPQVRLVDLCQRISSGGTPSRKRPEYFCDSEVGHFWVKSQELTDKDIYFTGECISDQGLKNSSAKYFPAGTVLIAMYGATVGKLGYLRIAATVNQAICGLEVDRNRADSRYVFYALRHTREALTSQAMGAAQQNLNQDLIRNFEIPLPGLNVQWRVGSILSAFDEFIENSMRRIEILDEMAQAIYREWFVEFRYPGHEDVPLVDSELGPIPEGWAVSGLGSVCTRIQAGGTPSRKNPEFWDDGDINWFRTTELQDGFLFDSTEKISQAGLEGSSAKMFDAGSILMAIYGSPTVGRLGILTRDATCNQAALALVPDETVLSHPFLYQTLAAMREHFNSIAQGAAQQNISKATVAGTLVRLPPRNLVDLYDQLAVPIWDLTRTLTQQVRNLRETRDLLLPKLISGEIDVSELDIELAGSSV